ncbi:MAG: anti-sigma regulatory factor [Bdellovibrionia bacterium]
MPSKIQIPIFCESDVLATVQKCQSLLIQIEMPIDEATLALTAVSEVSRNILNHATSGEVILSIVKEDSLSGLSVVAQDSGPGISDIEKSMADGYSTGKGLGLGLSVAKESMDEFEIESVLGQGTIVRMRKWVP